MRLAKGQRLGLAGDGFGDDRMTDEIAAHAGGLHQGRLKGQDRQHMVDDLGHLFRPPRPPCPDRGRDIMDGAQAGVQRPRLTRHAQAEIGAVDGDQRIGPFVGNGLRGLGDAGLQGAVLRQDFPDAHQRQLIHGKAAGQALCLHGKAANAHEFDIGRQLPEARHQRRAQIVARRLTRDQKELHSVIPFRSPQGGNGPEGKDVPAIRPAIRPAPRETGLHRAPRRLPLRAPAR